MRIFQTIGLLLGLLWVAGCAGAPPKAPSPTPDAVTPAACQPSALQQQWALATSAIITELNQNSHGRLGGVLLSDTAGVENATRILAQWWQIQSRQELMATLDWLANTGHRAQFSKDGAFIAGLDEQAFSAFLDKFGKTPEMRRQIIDLRGGYQAFGDRSILAWDIGRLVAVAGWGYVAGYITEQEAWTLIMPPAEKLQKAFGSWKEMGDNYLLGRRYWSRNALNDPGRGAWEHLLASSTSPWSRLPWETHLGCPTP